jgi:hypothetical protein
MESTVDPIIDEDDEAYRLLFLAANWSAFFEQVFSLPQCSSFSEEGEAA